MLGDITAADELYIVTGYTDMRKSIDGLCAIVEEQLHMDTRRSALYLFCGKRCDSLPGSNSTGLCLKCTLCQGHYDFSFSDFYFIFVCCVEASK